MIMALLCLRFLKRDVSDRALIQKFTHELYAWIKLKAAPVYVSYFQKPLIMMTCGSLSLPSPAHRKPFRHRLYCAIESGAYQNQSQRVEMMCCKLAGAYKAATFS